jgi:hypothetical protein
VQKRKNSGRVSDSDWPRPGPSPQRTVGEFDDERGDYAARNSAAPSVTKMCLSFMLVASPFASSS